MTISIENIIKWANENGGFLSLITLVVGFFLYPLLGKIAKLLKVKHKKRTYKLDEIAHQLKIKREIEQNFRQLKYTEEFPILIRDCDRDCHYLKTPSVNRGISSYFKLWLVYLYEKGIMVSFGALQIQYIKYDDTKRIWHFCELDDPGGKKVWMVGKIPYSHIFKIDWQGDAYEPFPHFYCLFDNKSEPYEDIFYCERIQTQEGNLLIRELTKVSSVKPKK